MAKTQSTLGVIYHFGAVRIYVEGSGTLLMKLISKGGTKEQTLTGLTMSTSTEKSSTKKANFNQEHAQLEIKVDWIDEYFTFESLTVFYRPVANSYPQV